MNSTQELCMELVENWQGHQEQFGWCVLQTIAVKSVGRAITTAMWQGSTVSVS